MLRLLDVLLFWAHILLMGFNLFGWIPAKCRRVHLLVAGATLFSWVILGIRFGLGYCFLTDWHWNIKASLGETGLPNSFVAYAIEKYTLMELGSKAVDYITGLSFTAAILASLYYNFMHPYLRKRGRKTG